MNTQHFDNTVNQKIPIRCIPAQLTCQQFIDLSPGIELLTNGFIFIDLTRHVILTQEVMSLFSFSHLMNVNGKSFH